MLINGAIMSFKAQDSCLKKMLEQILITNPVQNTTCWGRDLYSKVIDETVKIFPCSWFNTEWGSFLGKNYAIEPFKKNKHSEKLFDGAFTWHWHNRWDDVIESGSKFEILEKKINYKFIMEF